MKKDEKEMTVSELKDLVNTAERDIDNIIHNLRSAVKPAKIEELHVRKVTDYSGVSTVVSVKIITSL